MCCSCFIDCSLQFDLLGPLWKSQIPELIEKKTQLQDHITSAQDLVVPPSQFHAWNGDLDPAEDNLRAAVARTLTGTIEAEKEFNFWSEIVATHPEYIAKQHAADRRWDDDNRRLCEDALETLRDSVPKTIWKARQTILGVEVSVGVLNRQVTVMSQCRVQRSKREVLMLLSEVW